MAGRRVVRLRDAQGRVRAGVADGARIAVFEGDDPLALLAADGLPEPVAQVEALDAETLGPALLVPDDWSVPFDIELVVRDADGALVFEDRTSTASMRRSFAELVSYLRRDNPLAAGTVLLTGTGIVPPDDASLQPGQTVEIRVPGIGTLVNAVRRASEIATNGV
jgi:fumarylacetoacetate (FAA) hydrolase family protein